MVKLAQKLLDFIDRSPVSFFAVDNIVHKLTEAGFTRIEEAKEWKLEGGGKYFVVRNGSSIIAFKLPHKKYKGITAAAAHSDSPSFRIKPNAEHTVEDSYVKLDVEGYGGMIMSTWFDRPLSAAGRVMRETENGVRAELVNIDRDSLIIPSLAIHMSSDANKGHEYNIQRELAPLYGMSDPKEGFGKEIGENLGYDMYLYNRMKGTIWGKDEEFLSAPRLDDLECAFCITEAFIEEDRTKEEQSDMIRLMAVFDNEEVGSSTFQGAKSDFLSETLERINEALGFERSQLMRAKANSLMISADNAHAVHPNYTDKACPSNRPVINGGIVIKHNANRRYTTDAVSEALFRKICDRGKIPYQFFTNRSDMPGGSTLGNLSNEKVSFNTIDIGLAQLAMHSAYETAGTKDVGYLYEAMKLFFNTQIEASDNEFLIKE